MSIRPSISPPLWAIQPGLRPSQPGLRPSQPGLRPSQLGLRPRRQRGDMIEVFRTMKGFNRVEKTNWFRFRDNNSNRATRSTVSVSGNVEQQRENVLFKENVRLDTRKNFFSVRVVDSWNRIPDEIREQKTVNGFKNKYDEWIAAETRPQQH